jgi:hypothetical protein
VIFLRSGAGYASNAEEIFALPPTNGPSPNELMEVGELLDVVATYNRQSGNITVSWDMNPCRNPQFRARIELYENTSGDGIPLVIVQNLPAHVRTATFRAGLLSPWNYSIRVYVTDLFDNAVPSGLAAVAGTAFCVADYNHDDGATIQDIFDFFSGWFALDPRADINGVGGVTLQDIFDFLGAWFAGC